MSLVYKPMAWGCIVGVTLLWCIAGCGLKQEPVPLPPVPQAHEKAAPAPAPQAQEEAAPAGKPEITQVATASWYGPGLQGQETASGETFGSTRPDCSPSDAAAGDGGQSDQSGNWSIGQCDD